MSSIIGKLGSYSTAGEKKVYHYLRAIIENLEDTYCYYEPLIGDERPDFVVISRTMGVIILEIKDYLESHVDSVAPTGPWTLSNLKGVVEVGNPFAQIYQYWRTIIERLRMVSKNELRRCVVFSKISRHSECGNEIISITPSRITVMFKEDLKDEASFGEFLKKEIQLKHEISPERLKLIRGNLIPTSRLPTIRQTKLFDDFIEDADKLRLLDRDQELFAENLGDGHRLIFGVAGSGKTVILIARARYLALKHEDWKILVLCYNRNLANAIMRMLNPQDYDADIIVGNYHKWAKDVIMSAGKNYSKEYRTKEIQARNNKDEFFNEIVPDILIRYLNESKNHRYDAILIDEAQDFTEKWLKSVVAALNPETNSLLITCDGLQGIYARNKFYWSDAGIKARGRTKKLYKTYRSPREIGLLAKKVLPEAIKELVGTSDEFIDTKEYLRDGGKIDVQVFSGSVDEYKFIASQVKIFKEKDWCMLLILRRNMDKIDYAHPIFNVFRENDVKWESAKYFNLNRSMLYVGTPHNVKGLEADVVFIPEVNSYKNDLQLLYVAITRATRAVIITSSKQSELADILKKHG
ncbi:MAG: UvrD-helicase domain-containing protein [Promethearchaeota archaeon]